MAFKLGDDDLLSSAKFSIEVCVQQINNWMILNGLKLNEEKTELLSPSPSLEFVCVGGETIQPIWKTTLKRCARRVISI